MKKIIAIAASVIIAGAPLATLAAPWDSPDPHHHPHPVFPWWIFPQNDSDDDDSSSSSSSSSAAKVYNPCETSNPALGGKGCLYYVNGQVVTSNGDGTLTTAAGNIIDANGRIINTTAGGAKVASAYEFRFNHDVSNFSHINVDGVWVDPSNYSVRSGSTVITLNQAYVNTLSNGTHTLTAFWTDGVSMSAQFTVGSRSGGAGVPNTGEADNTAYYVMMGGALMVMAGAAYVLATNKE